MIQKILENCFTSTIDDESQLNAALAYIIADSDDHKYIKTNQISWNNFGRKRTS